MGRPLKIAKYNVADTSADPQPAVDIGYPTSTPNVGVVGGNVSISDTQFLAVSCIANVPGIGSGAAYIIRQKGKRKYLVTLTSDTTQAYANVCILTNTDDVNALTVNQMAIVATDASAANVALQSLTNNYALDFSNVGHYVSFAAANATVQPTGSGTTGLYNILLVPSA